MEHFQTIQYIYSNTVMMIMIFSLAVMIVTALFIHFKVAVYGNVIGIASLSIEAMLGIPQLVSNQTRRSV